MSNENKDSSDSTTLHLNQFAPGAVTKKETTAETGVTVMIKRAAAATVAQDGPPLVSGAPGTLPPQEMLGAVSYCYAKGVYESEEIERKMLRDTGLREAMHGEVPNARAIRTFRRLNRGAITHTLEKAFGFLRKREKTKTLQPLPGQPAVAVPPSDLGDSTVTILRHEAEDRVQQAAFIDNMSKE
jgi:hypothetical protein